MPIAVGNKEIDLFYTAEFAARPGGVFTYVDDTKELIWRLFAWEARECATPLNGNKLRFQQLYRPRHSVVALHG